MTTAHYKYTKTEIDKIVKSMKRLLCWKFYKTKNSTFQ